MIRRTVLIKSDHKNEIADVLARIPHLVEKVPGLVRAQAFEDIGGRSAGYDRLFVLEFTDKQAVDGWAEHSAHIPIRDALRALSDMLVFDHEV